MRKDDVADGPGPPAAGEHPPAAGDQSMASGAAPGLVWDVVVSHAGADTVWAQWLSWHLAEAGYRVTTTTPIAAPTACPRTGLLLVLWSAAHQGQFAPATAGYGPAERVLLVRLEDCPRPAPYAGLLAFDLFGLDADMARDWLLRQITVLAPQPAASLRPPPFPPPPTSSVVAAVSAHPGAGPAADRTPALVDHGGNPVHTAEGPPLAGHGGGTPGAPHSRPPRLRRAVPVVLAAPQRLAVLAQERGHPLAVAFSPAAPLIVTAGTDTAVHLWHLPFPDPPRLSATVAYGRRINQEWARAVTLSPDGRILAAAGDAGTTLLWQLSTPSPVLGAADTTTGEATAPGVGDGAALRPSPLLTLTGHRGYIHDLDFSPGGTQLATAGDDRVVLLWDLAEPGAPTRTAILAGHRAPVRAVAFSPEGTLLATAAADRTVTLWDLADPTHPTATVTLTGARGPVHTVAFSPDGDTLAAAGRDRTVRLYSVADPTRQRLIAVFDEHRRAVHAVTFSPDGHLLATASADRTVTVRTLTNPDKPGPPRLVAAHTGAVHAVAFAPDSRLLATASADRTTALWDLFPDEPPPPASTP
ncbi:hypothetical protein [Frankia sp. R82]|uniref:toll/interleukin-1 receptor domain-containing protein n=1 Tax=Frankia sp. R82 TaxID=2950553 RepID=UPI002043B879|nr:hypothetical protein [Frankia sp. R82]MCM3887166.1 hypothetical protein [Frankia sp. R82]